MCSSCTSFEEFVNRSAQETGMTRGIFAITMLGVSRAHSYDLTKDERKMIGASPLQHLKACMEYSHQDFIAHVDRVKRREKELEPELQNKFQTEKDEKNRERLENRIKDSKNTVKELDLILVSSDSWDRVKEHYRVWRWHFDALSTLVHLDMLKLHAKMERWTDRNIPDIEPFECKQVGMGDFSTNIPVYDQTVLTRSFGIMSSPGTEIRFELISSGVLEFGCCYYKSPNSKRTEIDDVKFNLATYKATHGRMLMVSIPARSWTPNTRIDFSITVFNGFQDDNQTLANKLPRNVTANKLTTELDFSDVEGDSAKFHVKPIAKVLSSTGEIKSQFELQQPKDDENWSATYEAITQAEERLLVSWKLNEKRDQ